jgi:enterochelin esterase family protein
MPVTQTSLRSSLLGNERRVWLQMPPANNPPTALCILLDGEYYVERMDAPPLIAELMTAGDIPPTCFVFVSSIDGTTRWSESFCNASFARFLVDELISWTAAKIGRKLPAILGGLSLTGLAAAHAGLLFPQSFTGVLCQSASFWWSDSRIVRNCRQRGPLPLRFRISCGADETTEYVEHAPELIQRTSQLASSRLMRDALREKGAAVSYEEFAGGHNIASWKADLPRSLAALLGGTLRVD